MYGILMRRAPQLRVETKQVFEAELLARFHDQYSNTQVSLVPPPCEEFTTSEPSFSATRVSPPGTVVISSPQRMKGRKSMWRGAMPCSTKVGQVDSASVGWAM